MITTTGAKRILFYGDSLVYGKASGSNVRLDAKTRFTGLIQDSLGNNWEVLEEGLRARMLYGDNAFFPERDGLEQFGPIIGSQLPVDILVIFLGSNNCNLKAAFSENSVEAAYRSYVRKLNEWCEFLSVSVPQILIVSPPAIDESLYDLGASTIFGPGAGLRRDALNRYIQAACTKLGLEVIDSSKFCKPAAGDGVHLDKEGNKSLARALAEKIKATR